MMLGRPDALDCLVPQATVLGVMDRLSPGEAGDLDEIACAPGHAFALGDEIEKTQGRIVRLERALVAALAVRGVRTYPAIKRGLRLSQSCAATRLEV